MWCTSVPIIYKISSHQQDHHIYHRSVHPEYVMNYHTFFLYVSLELCKVSFYPCLFGATLMHVEAIHYSQHKLAKNC
jgi:hypothetical protein